MPSELEFWQGEQGQAYIERNPVDPAALTAREDLWREILMHVNPAPRSVLELGAGQGQNLKVLQRLNIGSVMGVDASREACLKAEASGLGVVQGLATDTRLDNECADLVFTSGLLIHIPPDDLLNACFEAYRLARRWIVAIEYFSAEPRMVPYHGEDNRLWTRDFGAFYLQYFERLEPVACGFAWKQLTGLDNLTWWVFRKKANLPSAGRFA